MGLGKKTIDDENYCGKKVLVRCDFNVPMKDGVITDTKRIVGALVANFTSGSTQGGSTITQQLIKNITGDSEPRPPPVRFVRSSVPWSWSELLQGQDSGNLSELHRIRRKLQRH